MLGKLFVGKFIDNKTRRLVCYRAPDHRSVLGLVSNRHARRSVSNRYPGHRGVLGLVSWGGLVSLCSAPFKNNLTASSFSQWLPLCNVHEGVNNPFPDEGKANPRNDEVDSLA